MNYLTFWLGVSFVLNILMLVILQGYKKLYRSACERADNWEATARKCYALCNRIMETVYSTDNEGLKRLLVYLNERSKEHDGK